MLFIHLVELKTFNDWALCALCEQNMKIIWISRADGSTTKMTRHLKDEHNLELKDHTDDVKEASDCTAVQPVQPLQRKLITQHFTLRMSVEENTKAHALMIQAHCAALLPPLVNDIPEYREYIEFISRGCFDLPHRTKTTELQAAAAATVENKIRDSAKRASSISLMIDGVLAHTGESYVGVTGHWIDKQPLPLSGKFNWKLVSAVLAVKVDNKSHTADNIAALLKDCVNVKYQLGTRLDSITTDNGANFRAAVNQLVEQDIIEEDPSCACHTFNLVVKSAIDPDRTKVAESSTRDLVHLFHAALVHPGHKNLSWLSGVERIQAHSLFKEELFSVAGVDIDAADAPDDQPNAQSTGIEAKIALDAFFDFDVQVLDDDDLSLRQLSTKETVEDEFRRYLQAESTNWRSNDTPCSSSRPGSSKKRKTSVESDVKVLVTHHDYEKQYTLTPSRKRVYTRLQRMGVCLSSNTVRKTIDMMGRDHDVAVKKWVEELSSFIVPYSCYITATCMNETFSSSNESEAEISYSISDAESISPPSLEQFDYPPSLEQFDYPPSPVQHEQGRTSPDSPDVSFLSDDSKFGVDLADDDTSSRLSVCTDDSTDTAASVEGLLDPAVSTPSAAPVPASQLSFKLVGDNIDKTVRPRHMRVDHQAASLHYFNVYAVQDRISFQHLSNTARLTYPEDVDVNKFLPTAADSNALIQNFKVLMKRILVHYLPAVSHLADVNQHITHEWTAHMSMKSVVAPLGVYLKDENKLNEMVDILDQLHKYVPMVKTTEVYETVVHYVRLHSAVSVQRVNMCTVKKPTFLLAVLLLVAALCLADTTHEGNWSNPFCYRNVFNQSDHIAEVERVTLQRVTPEFVTSRMHRGQPYIVSGVTKGWPANHKWSHDYFERLFSGHELFSSTFSTPTSPDFSDIISAHETYYGIFLNSRDSARLVSTDYSYPSFIPPEWRITGNEWLHWGFPPCGAKRHMDIMCTSRLSVQVMGEKLWRLYPVTMATSTRHWNWTSHPSESRNSATVSSDILY
eukprot:Em0014g179a